MGSETIAEAREGETMMAAGAPIPPRVVTDVSMWPVLFAVAFALGVRISAWFGSHVWSSPHESGPAWGRPRERLEPPGPMGNGSTGPSLIDEIERFLAELAEPTVLGERRRERAHAVDDLRARGQPEARLGARWGATC